MQPHPRSGLAIQAPPVAVGFARKIGLPAHDKEITTAAYATAVVDAAGAAAFCGIKRSAWYKLRTQGRVPIPITLGRRVVWVIAELQAWLCAGAPPADRWTLLREQAMGREKHGR